MSEVIFEEFHKIARLNRDVVITEKIDGTNAQIFIDDSGMILRAGSRSRFVIPGKEDNHGFAQWAFDHEADLLTLGPGRHFGEWWGSGIQRGYGLPKGEKWFSLFNTHRWSQARPACCHVVPVLYRGPFRTDAIEQTLADLRMHGSYAAPFMNPEGIVIFHTHANQLFKVTLENDDLPKSLVKHG